MAVGDITRGSQVALPNISRLHSKADGVAEAFGEILGAGEMGNSVEFVIPIHASAVGGSYDVYMVSSQDGAKWTDNIDPDTTGDVVGKINDAKFLFSASTVYDATDRTEVVKVVSIPMIANAQYFGFVLVNNSGQAIPASGASGNSRTLKLNVA